MHFSFYYEEFNFAIARLNREKCEIYTPRKKHIYGTLCTGIDTGRDTFSKLQHPVKEGDMMGGRVPAVLQHGTHDHPHNL